MVDDVNSLRSKTQDQLTSREATTFLVTCMDFRLIDDACRAMDNMGYNNNYDQFIVAGASLGLCQTKYPHWGKTVMDHFEIGLALHNFREFIFIDHMDCGAYKKFYPEIRNAEDERALHKVNLQLAHDTVKKKFPDFNFKAYLMDLTGEIEEVAIVHDNTILKNTELVGDHFLSDISEKTVDGPMRKRVSSRTSIRKILEDSENI